MRYEDEAPSTRTLADARRKVYTGNVEHFSAQFEQLRDEAAAQTARVRLLEDQLLGAQQDRKQSAQRVVELSSENRKLKSLISDLRGSKSMKLGRWIRRPSLAARELMPYRFAISKIENRQKQECKKIVKSKVLPVSTTEMTAPLQKDPHLVLQVLQQNFQKDTSKDNLIKILSHHYYVRSNLLIPAAMISDYGQLLANLNRSEQSLVDKIVGQSLLFTDDPVLSAVQPNPGYFVERGRVMYCAHSTGDFDSNGYSTRTTGLVSGIAENSRDIFVAARPGYPWDSKTAGRPKKERVVVEGPHGVEFIYTPGPNLNTDRLDHFIANAADAFVREATRHRVAVIHSASNYLTALPALIAARRLGIPFVYEVRGLWEITEMSRNPSWEFTDRFKLATKLEAFVAKEADRVLAITTQVADTLVQRGTNRDNIDILPNAVDTNIFKPMPRYAALARKLNLDDESTVIGYAGSLVDYEGLSVLLDAVKILIDRGRNVRLVIVGDGPVLNDLKKQTSSLSLENVIQFTGRVPASEVPNYISLFDLMPCPRLKLPITELVSPLKPLEIMASGKALVLSNLAPSRDLAGETQSRALLAEPGDATSLANTLDKIVLDSVLRDRLGKEARIWAVAERTWERVARVAIDTYRQVELAPTDPSSRRLSDLTFAIIADEFTLAGIKPDAKTLELDPSSWRDQLENQAVDVLFVESAWSGNAGKWQGKVGFYDDESFSELKSLVDYCKQTGIPTIFWNKEDPIHFNRFEKTAAEFDHVFTTDSDCISKYTHSDGTNAKTVASLPFYAQPKLQNPLPGNRPYNHSVAYGGSYYGEKYKKRSHDLAQLLRSASGSDLTIYDRQHLNPASPYKFPSSLQPYVVGGLSYESMLEAYKAHPVHINVNSVDDSPTMFSRRVVEIAASGSAVISGTGRGVAEVLAGAVPVVTDSDDAALLISEWMSNEPARIRDAWRSYRSVFRSHTAAHRLAYVVRTAGLVVSAPELPKFAVFVQTLSDDVMQKLTDQTIAPTVVYFGANLTTDSSSAGLQQSNSYADSLRAAQSSGIDWLVEFPEGLNDRTLFEDLLVPLTYGEWTRISITDRRLNDRGLGLVSYDSSLAEDATMTRTSNQVDDGLSLQLRREITWDHAGVYDASSSASTDRSAKRILVAGHDLKFATGIIEELRNRGHEVLIDKWNGHSQHDEDASLDLLSRADIIFCEWSLGNAVWYSRNISSEQRLIVRLHSQEIYTNYLDKTNFNNIDNVIFVGQHIADIAIRDFDVPSSIVRIIPNYTDLNSLNRVKDGDARWNIGMVGIVPQGKRLDLALNLVALLRKSDDRYRLFIKGRRPEEYPWMNNRPEEMRFYQEQYARIDSDEHLKGAVSFDPFDDNMSGWYAKIGAVISVSDFESFHLTLADGAASGSLPLSLAWDGADQIYPIEWLSSSVEQMASRLLEINSDTKHYMEAITSARNYVEANFQSRKILTKLYEIIVGE